MYTRFQSTKLRIIKSTDKSLPEIIEKLKKNPESLRKIGTGTTTIYKAEIDGRELFIKKSYGEIAGNERVINDFNLSLLLFNNGISTPKPLGLIEVKVSSALLEKILFVFIREWSKGINLGEFLSLKPQIEAVEKVLENSIKLLAKLHSLNILHTDFFPRNILVENNLDVKVLDFEHSREEKSKDKKIKEAEHFIESILSQRVLPYSFASKLMNIYLNEAKLQGF